MRVTTPAGAGPRTRRGDGGATSRRGRGLGGLGGLAVVAAMGLAGCKAGPGNDALRKAEVQWPDLSKPAPQLGGGERDAAVIVSIGDYLVHDDLPGANRNGREWAEYFTQTLGIPATRVVHLQDKAARKSAIIEAVREQVAAVEEGGRIWLVFIGHGDRSEKLVDGHPDGLLVAYEAGNTVNAIEDGSIPHSEMQAMLAAGRGTPVTVIDACFSGKTSDGSLLIEGRAAGRVPEPSAGARGLVLTAAQADQYAGQLPGQRRPAFSYLLLGALRGWGDTNGDGNVSAEEALGFTQQALSKTLGNARDQRPDWHGDKTLVLARAGSEPPPDLDALEEAQQAMRAFGFGQGSVAVPEPVAARLSRAKLDVDMDVEEALDRAEKIQATAVATPEDKARAWCELAGLDRDKNVYRDEAGRACEDWKEYARTLRTRERELAKDYETVRRFLALEMRGADEKTAMLDAFLLAYQDMGKKYPRVEAVGDVYRKVKRGKEVSLPDFPEIGSEPDFSFADTGGQGGGSERSAPSSGGEPWSWNGGALVLDPAIDMPMVRIEGGTFTLGSDSSDPDRDSDEIPHEVRLSTFWMAETEVTQAQWKAVMGTTPSDCSVGCGDDFPVDEVSWNDAVAFANTLSTRLGLSPCYERLNSEWVWRNKSCDGFRLPTEAEWEYAARAGTRSPYSFGTRDQLCSHANFRDDSGDRLDCDRHEGLAEVRSYPPNPWGLYEMHGNVREWVWDYYAPYSRSQQVLDPTGPEQGEGRSLRGGAFVNDARFLRSSFRDSIASTASTENIGFRVVRRVP